MADKWSEFRTRLRLTLGDVASAIEFRNTRWLRTTWMNFKLAVSALWWRG